MADKQGRRSSLTDPFQVLRNTFGGRRSSWELEDNNNNNNNNNNTAHSKSVHRTARSFSSGPSTSTQNSSPVSSFSTNICRHSPQRQPRVQTHRQVSMPLTGRRPLSGYSNNLHYHANSHGINRSNLHTEDCSTQAWPVASSHNQTNIRYASTQISSRIPTPAKSPAGDLYSHDVYRKEGRRNFVLSSLGKWYWDTKRDTGRINEENRETDDEREKPSPNEKTQCLISQRKLYYFSDATSKSRPHMRTYDQRTIENSRIQKATIRVSSKKYFNSMPLAKSTSIPCVTVTRPDRPHTLPASPETGSQPSSQLFNPVSTLPSQFETVPRGAESIKTTHSSASGLIYRPVKALPFGKERVENHGVPKRALSVHHQCTGDRQPMTLRATNNMRKKSDKMEYITKGLRWTSGFENLRLETRARSSGFSASTRSKVSSRNAKRLSPLSDTGVLRLRDQSGRMVLSSSHSLGTRSRLKKPGLTVSADYVSQVSESQPQQYWLGRFVTLVNAFHYEDSFNEPDIATGFGMLSSYSRPLGHPESNDTGYRVKRAFMVLENVCMNDEASASLRKFRNEYVDKFGDRWLV
ncbi:hypothetical protein BDV28DRAFT_162791 [Aspergillus coremiiformis]|uniref:Uncharacterized protein n=1 Tax=Aspergillus coremiiformis TaxID=138285 RepID=A0A5N6YZ51_9EURO|nr:hypothetical protein BDV28DRAFT_162791 [Aspergillus coremiiformis]